MKTEYTDNQDRAWERPLDFIGVPRGSFHAQHCQICSWTVISFPFVPAPLLQTPAPYLEASDEFLLERSYKWGPPDFSDRSEEIEFRISFLGFTFKYFKVMQDIE